MIVVSSMKYCYVAKLQFWERIQGIEVRSNNKIFPSVDFCKQPMASELETDLKVKKCKMVSVFT